MTNESSTEVKISGKRSATEYDLNPSLPVAASETKVGTRRISNKTGDKCMIVSAESGEIVSAAGFHEFIEVDKTQFVKLYVGGVAAFNDLSAAGAKVFRMVYNYVAANPQTDSAYLHYKDAKSVSRATFDRGVIELLQKEIIYKSTRPNIFFININYMFNGNRLALVKEYRLKEAPAAAQDWQQTALTCPRCSSAIIPDQEGTGASVCTGCGLVTD